MPSLVHELLLTLWKKFPRHFGEYSKVCAALWMEALRAWGNPQMDRGLGEAEWPPLRQNRFIRPKIKCLLGPDQVFSKCNFIIASPGKERVQRPQPFTEVLCTLHITNELNDPKS